MHAFGDSGAEILLKFVPSMSSLRCKLWAVFYYYYVVVVEIVEIRHMCHGSCRNVG